MFKQSKVSACSHSLGSDICLTYSSCGLHNSGTELLLLFRQCRLLMSLLTDLTLLTSPISIKHRAFFAMYDSAARNQCVLMVKLTPKGENHNCQRNWRNQREEEEGFGVSQAGVDAQ